MTNETLFEFLTFGALALIAIAIWGLIWWEGRQHRKRMEEIRRNFTDKD